MDRRNFVESALAAEALMGAAAQAPQPARQFFEPAKAAPRAGTGGYKGTLIV